VDTLYLSLIKSPSKDFVLETFAFAVAFAVAFAFAFLSVIPEGNLLLSSSFSQSAGLLFLPPKFASSLMHFASTAVYSFPNHVNSRLEAQPTHPYKLLKPRRSCRPFPSP
jgi:hypothetical protein